MIEKSRRTKETDIHVRLDINPASAIATGDIPTDDRSTGDIPTDDGSAGTPPLISSGIPFLDHLLGAWALHGNFLLMVKATGDLEVDYHHTVEDIGLVLGDAIAELYGGVSRMTRFGHALIPMDDALAEVTLDLCNRPYCVYHPILPQQYILDFDTALIKEFFTALVARARITLHLSIRHAENSHHAIEALFKAFGIALWRACQPHPTRAAVSTKGAL